MIMLVVSEAIEKVSRRGFSFGLATLRPALMGFGVAG